MTELILIIVLALLIPVLSLRFFIIGFNMNAHKKIELIKKKEKVEKTEEEDLLERIENAHV